MRFDLGPDLATIKAAAIREIDDRAEQARLLYITPGAGQALEYQQTEMEARAYIEDALDGLVEIAHYPFLRAEMDAVQRATGIYPSAHEVAMTVIAEADAWREAGSRIKMLRREAKMRVQGATSIAEVRAATQIDWPMPEMS